MRTALVTGVRGFVGQHMARRLEEDGWWVGGNDIAGPVALDCREQFARDVTHYDLVVHCAAVVGGRETISGDPLAVAVDLELDAAMFRWAVRTKQKRVVYFSSAAAYPLSLQEAENRCHLGEWDFDLSWPTIGKPDMTYGWAKVTGELLAGYAEAEGVPVHIFRPFSGYGSDQADVYPFPAFIDRALRRDDPFDIWGDGTAVRDFVHVDDIVETVMAAVDQDCRGPLNIGTGDGTTFDALANAVTYNAGYFPQFRHLGDKPTGPAYRVADVTLLHRLRPPKISLGEGIRRALTDRNRSNT